MKKKMILLCMAFLALLLASCAKSAEQPATPSQVEVANPASEYCVQQGGKLEMRENAEGQYGVCILPNGGECEEWAFFRKECS